MKLSLLIHPGHAWQSSVRHSLLLAQAMTDQGHQVTGVFFYGTAAQIFNDPVLSSQWLDWQHSHECDLLLCRTMLEHQQLQAPPTKDFQVVGMASWLAVAERADRIIEVS